MICVPKEIALSNVWERKELWRESEELSCESHEWGSWHFC